MSSYPQSLEHLLEELQQLPTVGPKTASRLAFYLLGAPKERVEALARAMIEVKERLTACTRCGNLAQGQLCEICSDPRRDARLLCVVANTRDLMAMESSGEYTGLYHVLGGLISPLDGIGPAELNVGKLVERLKLEPVEELIIATNPTVPGEATALYLKDLLKLLQVDIAFERHFELRVVGLLDGDVDGESLAALDVTLGGVEVGVAGHHHAGLHQVGEQHVLGGAALMGGDDVLEARELRDGVLHVVERAGAAVALVALHHGGPLAVAHGARAAVGQQVDVHVVALQHEDVVVGLFQPLLALFASAFLDGFDHLDFPCFCKGKFHSFF